MKDRKRCNQIAIIISFIVLLLLVCYTFYSKWQKEKNIFIYEERRLLVQSYTNSFMEENELSGYIDNIMECISGNSNMVMASEVICNEDMKNNIRMGTITVNCNSK